MKLKRVARHARPERDDDDGKSIRYAVCAIRAVYVERIKGQTKRGGTRMSVVRRCSEEEERNGERHQRRAGTLPLRRVEWRVDRFAIYCPVHMHT